VTSRKVDSPLVISTDEPPTKPKRKVVIPFALVLGGFLAGCTGSGWIFRLKDLGVEYGGAKLSTTVEVEHRAPYVDVLQSGPTNVVIDAVMRDPLTNSP